MSLTRELEHLKRRVNEIRAENWNGQRFVPEDQLSDIITRDSIVKALGILKPAYLTEEVVDFIVKRATKVFAILLLTDHVDEIKRFIQNDQFGTHRIDHQLPFTVSRLSEILDDEYKAKLFHEKQWEFTAPIFSGRVMPRTLEKWTVLPYLSEKHLATGGFGSVYKIKIHPTYHPPAFPPTAEFVRKELGLDDTTFENEAQVLSILQRLKHPNILNLIGCYTYQSKHNLISPFVADGNLQEFLKRDRPKDLCREDLFCSLAGLSSAIWALHEFIFDDSEPKLKGHHQDLRPENILVSGTRFILADFGLSSIKSLSTNSRTPFKGRKGYCQAPECVDLFRPYQEHDVTRAIDIFAFACIIVDVLIYLFKGATGVQEFRVLREFQISPMCYSLYHKGDSSNEAVIVRLQEIALEDRSQSMQEVVQLTRQMLEVLPQKRPTAAMVTAKLCASTMKAFSEGIMASFAKLPMSLEMLIERSRFSSWLACQDEQLFLSMSGATTTSGVFESAIRLLRQTKEALAGISTETPDLDSRELLEVRTLTTQLLNMLPPGRRASSRSHLESKLLAEVAATSIDIAPSMLRAAFGESRISQMAETKELVAQSREAADLPSSHSIQTILSSEFTKTSTGSPKIAKVHQPRHGRSRSMLVETIPYGDPLTGQKLLPRVQALYTLLSSKGLSQSLQIPPVYALCDNSEDMCYDLLYEYPRTAGAEKNRVIPVSLRQLLVKSEAQIYPILEDRYKLALDLAEAIAAFHEVEWFHKDLTSSNILFFPTNESNPSTKAQNPYLFGFRHSRHAADEFTTGPLQDKMHQRYHHPGYIFVENRQFKSFVRQYDWYSLGILLFEIGFWAAIEDIMAEHAKKKNEEFATVLVEEKLRVLAFHMGAEYSEIVRFCLTCSEQSQLDTGATASNVLGSSSIPPNLIFKGRVAFPLRSLVARHSAQEVSRKRKHVADKAKTAIRSSRQRIS